jgi:arylsulfatase A
MSKVSRRSVLSAGGAAILRSRLAAAPRRNTIFILADDLGYGDMGCYGSHRNRTPNLDRLAADGVRFTNHYTCGPVCSPARAGLMTGLVPDRTGVTGVLRDPDDARGLALNLRTMAQEFKSQGMKTALLGKWHLGMSEPYWPTRRGFDYFWGYLSGTIDYYTHLSRGGGGTGKCSTYENERKIDLKGYFPELQAAKAVDFVEQHRDAPYFLYLALALPHTPLEVPDRWVDPFRNRLPKLNATYAGIVSCIDSTVGRIREALERTGQWDRTTIVFSSDHGWVKKHTPEVADAGSNAPFRGGKYELWEGGIRTPCIARRPGVTRPGTVSDTFCWLPDWFATLTGKPTSDAIDLRSALEGKPALGGRHICWRFEDTLVKTPLSYAVRQDSWKLLRIGGERYLFDLRNDPGEKQNMLDRRADLAEKLEEKLRVWKSSIGDRG